MSTQHSVAEDEGADHEQRDAHHHETIHFPDLLRGPSRCRSTLSRIKAADTMDCAPASNRLDADPRSVRSKAADTMDCAPASNTPVGRITRRAGSPDTWRGAGRRLALTAGRARRSGPRYYGGSERMVLPLTSGG